MTMDMSEEDKKTLNQSGEMEMEGEPAADPSWMEGAEAPKQKNDAVSPTWLEGHEPPAEATLSSENEDDVLNVGFDAHFKPKEPNVSQEDIDRYQQSTTKQDRKDMLRQKNLR